MTGNRLLLHSVFLFLLPVIVAWFGISVGGAIALVLLVLLWRWLISLSTLVAPARIPRLELVTISASHFSEKARWCLDRLGVDYAEKPAGGTLNAFFLGRSVPLLRMHTGTVRSSIGNSAEILRYLWGRYAVEFGDRAAFLEPTSERLEFERKLDRVGVDLQVWVYYHILPDRELTLHAWGVDNKVIPAWQRLALRILFPLQRLLMRKSFRITPNHHDKAVEHIETLLAEVEKSLADERKSILGGDTINYTDITYSALLALAVQPVEFGAGKADSVRIALEDCPAPMRHEIESWRARYPRATGFIDHLYREER